GKLSTQALRRSRRSSSSARWPRQTTFPPRSRRATSSTRSSSLTRRATASRSRTSGMRSPSSSPTASSSPGTSRAGSSTVSELPSTTRSASDRVEPLPVEGLHVVDDFLDDPDEVRAFALEAEYVPAWGSWQGLHSLQRHPRTRETLFRMAELVSSRPPNWEELDA